jgi:hypothetical protein
MTHKPTRDDRQRLEALYREHGETEPDAGLDWRIRARAHREARSGRLPRPGHWLGGAAVAASLFVVVSVVMRMEPPQGGSPDAVPLQREPSPGAEDSLPAPRRRESSEQSVRQLAPARSDRAAADAFEPAPPPALFSRAESAGESERASDELLEEERARTLERLAADRVPLDPELGFPDGRIVPETGPQMEVEQRLWLIEQYLSVGNEARAREELERFRVDFPQANVPKSLTDALDGLEAEVKD